MEPSKSPLLPGGDLFAILQTGRCDTSAIQRIRPAADVYRIEYVLQGSGYISPETDGSIHRSQQARSSCSPALSRQRSGRTESIPFSVSGLP